MNTVSQLEGPFYRTAEQISSFVNQIETVYMLDGKQSFGAERRAVERMNVTMPVEIKALDDELIPLDYQYNSISRDISVKGVGLVTTSPIGRSHVLLTLQPCHGDSFSVIARVTYCRDLGHYFQVGCEFLVS